MSRVTPIEDTEALGMKDMFDAAEKMMGFTSVDALIMAHRPDMLKSTATWLQSILQGGTVDPGLKRLMGFIVSTSSGCTYCSAHTNYTAKFYGVDEAKMKDAWSYQSSDLFTAQEKAALNLAFQSSKQPNNASDEVFDHLRKYFNDEEIVELVFTISVYAFLNRFNDTMKTELEDAPRMAYEARKK